MMIYILIIISLLLFLFRLKESFISKEFFNVTFYNDNINIEDDKNVSEIESIKRLFDDSNQFPDYKNTFEKEPVFQHNKFLEIIITNNILKRISDIYSYKNSKLVVVKNMYNRYFVDKLDDRHLIFDLDIKNETLQWIHTFKFYIVIKNIKNILLDTGEYTPQLSENSNVNIEIKQITLQTPHSTTVKPMEDYIGYENFYNYYNILNKHHLMDPYLTSGKDMIITNEMRNLFNLELQKKKLENQVTKDVGNCYKTEISGAIENIDTKKECLVVSGIWDTVPKDSSLCPFYKKNTNYPNNFGALNSDFCELPLNMERIGNRFYNLDPKKGPLCYNCKDNLIGKGSLGLCCDDQNDKEKYPLLLSPDYAFENDTTIRSKYYDILSLKKLDLN